MPRLSRLLRPAPLIVLAALLLLAFVPTYPYLQAGVPRTNDLVPHLHRAFALDALVRQGVLWPRWSPDLVHGFGYPVFNFFPSLSHWVTVVWHLFGLPLLTAYRAAVFTHFALAAVSSFALGRQVTRRPIGGWLLAVFYTLSPYLLYDAHVRGSPPESQALALLPLLVLGLLQLMKPNKRPGRFSQQRAGWLTVTAVVYAAMVLSHHPVTLQISLLMAIWLLLDQVWPGPGQTIFRPQTLLWAGGALALGGGLSAFFSLPALLEIDATRATLSISQGYTFDANFLRLGELFRWPMLPADPQRINPPVVRPLPLFALAIAVASLPLAWRRLARTDRRLTLQLTLLLTLSIWLILPASEAIWANFPLLRFTLYPWRFLGWASLALALLATLGLTPLLDRRPHDLSRITYHVSLILLTLLPTLEAIPWLFPPREALRADVTAADVAAAEAPPFLVGTTTLGEFLPAGVAALPDTSRLQAAVAAGENPDRLLAPEEVTRVRQSADPLDARYLLNIDRPVTLVYRQFFFPGWRAEANGQELPLSPAVPTGLITFDLATGTHELRIWFGTTPIRTAGALISAAAAVLWVVLVVTAVREWTTGPVSEAGSDAVPLPLYLPLLPLGLLVFFAWVDTPLRRPTLQPDGIWGVSPIEPIDYAGELRLLAYEQSAAEIGADEAIELTTYWRPLRGIGVDYAFGVQVVDEEGVTWHRTVSRPADWRFVAGEDIWPLDHYRLEPFEITLLDGTPPGHYNFLVGLVRRDTGQTVAAREIGGFTVTRASPGGGPLENGMRSVSLATDGLTLVGSRQDRREARPGDPTRVTTLWEVGAKGPAGSAFNLRLVDEKGEPALSREVFLDGDLPTSGVRPGDRLRSEVVLRLPAELDNGIYHWEAAMAGQTAVVGELAVNAPVRSYETPDLPTPLRETLGEVATLLGAETHPCPDAANLPCAVTLYWRAEATPAVSYRVFVHLVDEAGAIVSQSDGEPAAWSRPTTGWLPGEIVRDDHVLPLPPDLPPGRYTLRAGMYNGETGARLAAAGGEDSVVIPIADR